MSGDSRSIPTEGLTVTSYDQFRGLAEQRLRREHSGQRSQREELVHEAFLRPPDAEALAYENRDHYLRMASVRLRLRLGRPNA